MLVIVDQHSMRIAHNGLKSCWGTTLLYVCCFSTNFGTLEHVQCQSGNAQLREQIFCFMRLDLQRCSVVFKMKLQCEDLEES